MSTTSDAHARARLRAERGRRPRRNREGWSCQRSCLWAPPLLDEVDEREDRDPHDVDEVPVQRRNVHEQRVLRSEPSAIIDREQREEPEYAGRDVRTVEAGE